MSGSYYQLNQKYNQLLALQATKLSNPLDSNLDANGFDILNVNDIELSTINGEVYPTPSGGSYWIENTSGNVSGADITAPVGAYSILNATTLPVDLYVGGVLSTSLDVNSSTSLTSLTSPLLEIVAPFSFTPRVSGTSANFTAIAVGDDSSGDQVMFAVGQNGELIQSGDGINWILRTSGFGSGLITGVAIGGSSFNTRYIIVGQSGQVSTSNNGSSWTPRTSGFGIYTINCVVWGDTGGSGTWVIGGGTGTLATSTNRGSNWTLRTSGFGSFTITCVAFGSIGGVNTFVIGGFGGQLATSPDGITWTLRTSGFGAQALSAIGYGQIGGVGAFIATGTQGILTSSTDGINWIVQSPGFGTNTIFGIAYGDVNLGGVPTWVGVSSGGLVRTSPDGVVWTARNAGMGVANLVVAYGQVSGIGSYILGGGAGGGSGLISTSNLFPAPIKAQLTPITYQSIP